MPTGDTRGTSMTAVPIHRSVRHALACALVLLLAGACGEHASGPLEVHDGPESAARPSTEFLSTLVVSNPVTPASATAGLALAGLPDGEVVFVALPPGTFPNGRTAVIRTRGTQAEATVAMTDGGFDPIPVEASAGDTLDIRIDLADAAGPLLFHSVVPPDIPPVIVRTDPPPMKHDVPLNVFLRVVFSEPIDPATLTASSVQLLLDGDPVAGTLELDGGMNVTATFTPAAALVPEAEYSVLITREIRDLDGDPLAEEFRTTFTTAIESITVQAVRGWDPSTFEMNPYYSYRWWTGPDANSGDCPMNDCPARRLTISRISQPAGVVLELVATSDEGFDGVIGGHVPPGATTTVAEWVGPSAGSVRYLVTLTLLDGRVQTTEFDSYAASAAALPAADIAFVSNRDGMHSIYVANADGSDVTRVSEGLWPAWSPDGRSLAFFRMESAAGPSGIYVLDRDRSLLTYAGPGSRPTFSPDGRIAFDNDEGIAVMNADGSGVTQLFGNTRLCPSSMQCGGEYRALAPAWSPDGRSIAFLAFGPDEGRRTGIGILDAAGSGSGDFHLLPNLDYIYSGAVWSPDGSGITVITIPSRIPWYMPAYPYDFNTYDMADAGWHVVHTAPGLGLGGAPYQPDWSPDGSLMLFSAHSGQGVYPYLNRRLFTLSLETGMVRQLIPDATDPVVADYSDWGAVWARVSR